MNSVSPSSSHVRFDQSSPEIKSKVDSLLSKMTLEEKVGQMILHYPSDSRLFQESMISDGHVGAIGSVPSVQRVNELQKLAVEESRLGIPLLVANNVIHGFRTIYPIPLAVSCAWDPDLVEKLAEMASQEAAAFGTNWNFAPMVDLSREPRWGRVAEGAGEDVFLHEEIAKAYIRGYQSSRLENGRTIAACAKHFLAYGASESGKDFNTVDVSERSIRETYLPPFLAAMEEGNGMLISAFNAINGIPGVVNPFILQTLLRDELGFDGVLASDYNAVAELVVHGVAHNLKDAARQAALAQIDIDIHSPAYRLHLADLVREDAVPEARIDQSVRRILRLKFMLGLFDSPYTDETMAERIVGCDAHRKLALQAAKRSVVLLKNQDNLLPLSPSVKRVALIGPLADDPKSTLGCWSNYADTAQVKTICGALQAALPEEGRLVYVPGCEIDKEQQSDFADAVSAAKQADVAVVVLGETAAMGGEARSRSRLGLPGAQQALLEAVYQTGTPVVLVLMNGRPLSIPWAQDHVPAIQEAWNGGVEGGPAVVETLFGQSNPSGKLTMSFPRSVGQVPIYYDHKITGRPAIGEGVKQAWMGGEGLSYADVYKSTYIDQSTDPLYSFGHGLSYTSFEYANLVVHTPTITPEQNLDVSVDVTNTGTRQGDEIVQLYVQDLVACTARPIRQLKGFQRVSLEPGETQTVRFDIPAQRLSLLDVQMNRIVEPGEFKLWVATDSTGGLEGTFSVVPA